MKLDDTKEQTEPTRPKFDFTITFGDVVMLLGFLGAIFIAWTNLDKRVVVLEERTAFQKTVDFDQDSRAQMQFDLIRKSQERIENKLDAALSSKDGRR